MFPVNTSAKPITAKKHEPNACCHLGRAVYGKACRCLEFLLAASTRQEQLLTTFINGGIMPILMNVMTAYTEAVQTDADNWSPGPSLLADVSDCDSCGEPMPTSVPSGAAVVACLSLLQVCFCKHPCLLSHRWPHVIML